MRTIEAVKHGVVPGTQAAAALRELLHGLQGSTEETVLVFEKGDYHIRAQDCTQEMLYITNTVGDKEFGPGETPHLNAVPFFLKNIQNLTIHGGGARFILDGKATNMALQGCENIADGQDTLLENLTLEAIVAADPDFIFITTMGADDEALASLAEHLQSGPAWAGLTAVNLIGYVTYLLLVALATHYLCLMARRRQQGVQRAVMRFGCEPGQRKSRFKDLQLC